MSEKLTFKAAGSYGMQSAVADGFLYIRIPTDRKLAKAPGVDPNTGKAKVYHMQASTGGWTGVDGTDIRLSLNAGFKGGA